MNPFEQEATLAGSDFENCERPKHFDEPLRLVHHHPGYLRVQADAFIQKSDGGNALVLGAEAAVSELPGFRSWSHQPITGSIVIEYDPAMIEADDLLKHIGKKAGFQSVENATRHKKNREELVNVFMDGVQDLNKVVGQATNGKADLRELVPVALAATSVVSFILNDDRGRLPDWNNALYHSYRIFMHWHKPEVRTREKAEKKGEV